MASAQGSSGSVRPLYRVPAESLRVPRLAALISALAGLGSASMLAASVGEDATDGVVSVDPAGGVAGAVAAVHRSFGLREWAPGAQRRVADGLAGLLGAFGLTELAGDESGAGKVAGRWKDVRGCGYSVGVSGGRTRYRSCLIATPLADARGWPMEPAGLPAFRWSVRIRPGRAGPSAAFVACITSANVVDLAELAAVLGGAFREQGWDLVRPGSGQQVLRSAMVPGAANPRLPGSLFFVPPAGGEPPSVPPADPLRAGGTDALAPVEAAQRYVLRVTRGPRRGLQAVVGGPVDVGRGGAELDLADEAVDSRHVRLEPVAGGVSLVCAPASAVRVDGEPAGPPATLAPGSTVQLGCSEIVLLRPGGVPAATARGPVRATALEVSVRLEEEDRSWSVGVDGQAGTTVADVVSALAGYLGLSGGAEACLYRERDGWLPAPDTPWERAGIVRGDVVVLGPLPPGSELPWPAAGGEEPSANGPVVPLSRPPRTVEAPGPHGVELPSVPQETSLRARGGHWQVAAGAGLGLTAIAGGLLFQGQLWLAVAGGCTSLFSVTAGLMADRSRRRHQERAFMERVEVLDGELDEAVRLQAEAWALVEPAPAALAAWVALRSHRLWERRSGDTDFLALRLGTADRPSLLALEGRPSPGPLGRRLDEVLQRHAVVREAPLRLPGTEAGVVGIAGPEPLTEGLARWLLLQAAALHAPRDLSIGVLATGPGWSWVRWLPHVQGPAGPAVALAPDRVDDLARSLGRPSGASGEPWTLVLADHDAAARPAVAHLLDPDAATRRTVLVLRRDPELLPSRAGAVVRLRPDGGVLSGAGAGGGPRRFRPETLTLGEASTLARSLAPLVELGARPPSAAGRLGLLDLLGIDDPADAPVETLWRCAEGA